MEQLTKVSKGVFVGPQPSQQDLRSLADDFATIVNLCSYDEDGISLSPGDEGVCVRELGMEYLSIPVSQDELTAHRINDFRVKLKLLEKPVLVHCAKGRRSAAFAMMDRAVRESWSGDETLQKAKDLGLEIDVPELEHFVKAYIDGDAR